MEAAESPFFVIGSPRSGTTLLRLLLTSHPSLVIPPECGFITWLHPEYGDWRRLEFSDREHVHQFAQAVRNARKFETWRIDTNDIAQAVAAAHPATYAQACGCIYRLFCHRVGKASAMWGDKNNFYLTHIGLLRNIFPQARFVHIVRDGRDVACSYREVMAMGSNSVYRPELPIELEQIARRWSDDIRAIRKELDPIEGVSAIELRYEDLTSAPETELEGVCKFLGVDFAPTMLTFYDANRRNELEPSVTLDWKRRTLEPISTGTVGQYRKVLSAVDIERFDEVAGAELRRYRYIND
jgi:hypothetical protein